MPAIVAVTGDQHVNSVSGLCPPVVARDDGSEHRPSKTQRAVWRKWKQAWAYVDDLRRRRFKPDLSLYVVLPGDLVDKNSHDGVSLIAQMRTTIQDMALDVFAPVAERADHLFVVRGTEAHTGPRGELEEWLADDLGAEPDPLTDNASWWHLLLEVEGVTFDIAHHPQTTASRPWTWPSAAARHARILHDQYQDAGAPIPDIACRFHRHHYQPGIERMQPFFVYGPSWQLTTPFGYRLGSGALLEPVGMLIFIVDDGAWTFDDSQIFEFPRRQAWKA